MAFVNGRSNIHAVTMGGTGGGGGGGGGGICSIVARIAASIFTPYPIVHGNVELAEVVLTLAG
jgi:hypothetical protein